MRNYYDGVIRRFQAWALRTLPAFCVVRPAECFIALLCFLTGLGIVTGNATPRAADAVLPEPFFYGWGGVLVVGALMVMCGLTSIRWLAPPVSYTLTRVPCFRFGLKLLGWGSLVYVGTAFIYSGLDAMFAAGLALLFSGMCWARLLTVGRGV